MTTVVRWIGSLVVTLIILSVPALFVLSLAFDWDEEIKWIFTVLMIGVILYGTSTIYLLQERNGE